ncbi:hypothetical protein EVAR_58921_1 [Eumeta japonica]|uniref:Uncharacterized protein n=1 Tax=Eumeta variegata TaxID=151549 RepID=A0A4C1YAB6_EUMVA|nr:hypothetical protein EVAR_58921_1 [Eumeta japonica]
MVLRYSPEAPPRLRPRSGRRWLERGRVPDDIAGGRPHTDAHERRVAAAARARSLAAATSRRGRPSPFWKTKIARCACAAGRTALSRTLVTGSDRGDHVILVIGFYNIRLKIHTRFEMYLQNPTLSHGDATKLNKQLVNNRILCGRLPTP